MLPLEVKLKQILYLYQMLSPTMQKAVKSMLDVWEDNESTEVERDMALNTLNEIFRE